jgi:hypothetical protein
MLVDLSRLTNALREETLAASVAKSREQILRQLRETGEYTIREGGLSFRITIPLPPENGRQRPGER